ncbi:MAG TPA: hypothetical protein VN633_20960 [Bryobacteraceae bacterium]|jgi:hypothetical protein|nr:hypothetical protein [Bryobacteraceae bacterium]HXR78100.1 hypothetical protein [Bryobacteraceae bacterium]
MPNSLDSAVEAAWNSMWDRSTPYHLPTSVRTGLKSGLTWIKPLDSLPFANTGDVVLFNRPPWGGVSIDLQNNEVSQLDSAVNEGLSFDPQTGIIQGKIRFTEVKYTGKYIVRRGRSNGSALMLGGSVLKNIQGAPAPGDDANITLAKSYQSELLQNKSGRFMLGSYYDHNEAYCKAFTNDVFRGRWQSYPTNGKTTSYYAAQTSTAAQSANRNTVSVNGTPDNTGYSDYNSHAFSMQLMLVAVCNCQGNNDAATAASNFHDYSQPHSTQSQTVNSVLGIVSSSTPPVTRVDGPLALQSASPAPKVPEPAWKKKIREDLAPVLAEIQKEEDDVRRGIKLRETTGLPIYGEFRAYIATSTLTITGSVRQDEAGEPVVEFTRLSGDSPEVNLTLSPFQGGLFPEVEASLAKANFLKAVLGKRIVSALGSPKLLTHLSQLMNMATSHKPGRVVGRVREYSQCPKTRNQA